MAKGSSISGNGGGTGGGNNSYTIDGRGIITRLQMVKEIKLGKHPDTHIVKVNGKEFARNNPNHDKPDNINE